MNATLAQLGGRTTGPAYSAQSSGGVVPKPATRGQAVGYAVVGVVLLVVVFGVVIKFMRRDE